VKRLDNYVSDENNIQFEDKALMENKNVQNEISLSSKSTLSQEMQVLETKVNEAATMLKSRNLSKEEHDRIWDGAYEKSVELLEYRIEIGREILETPSASGYRSDLLETPKEVGKKAVFAKYGLKEWQGYEYQNLAKYPEVVEQIKEQAKEEKELITTYMVASAIAAYKAKQSIQREKELTEKNDSESSNEISDTIDDCNIQDSVEPSIETTSNETSNTKNDCDVLDSIKEDATKVSIHIEVSVEDEEAFLETLRADKRITIISIHK
jgi:hypothetical protein